MRLRLPALRVFLYRRQAAASGHRPPVRPRPVGPVCGLCPYPCPGSRRCDRPALYVPARKNARKKSGERGKGRTQGAAYSKSFILTPPFAGQPVDHGLHRLHLQAGFLRKVVTKSVAPPVPASIDGHAARLRIQDDDVVGIRPAVITGLFRKLPCRPRSCSENSRGGATCSLQRARAVHDFRDIKAIPLLPCRTRRQRASGRIPSAFRPACRRCARPDCHTGA